MRVSFSLILGTRQRSVTLRETRRCERKEVHADTDAPLGGSGGDASGLSGASGVRLVREAFNPKSKPLTDMDVEEGEREAWSALFAGALGFYKNPHSHRDVNLDDPAEAIGITLVATHLLCIVDARAAAARRARHE